MKPQNLAAPSWASRYVGIPYSEVGFDFSGCHCWGLAVLVYREELRIELPRFDVINARDLAAIVEEIDRQRLFGPWREVDGQQEAFDVILMRSIRCGETHIGIAANGRFVLHVERGTESVCVAKFHPSIAGRIVSRYRYVRSDHGQNRGTSAIVA